MTEQTTTYTKAGMISAICADIVMAAVDRMHRDEDWEVTDITPHLERVGRALAALAWEEGIPDEDIITGRVAI